MVLITPSQWLKNEIEKSFLKDYETVVIHNGVDTSIFKPTPSDIRQQYGIEDKKIILGVASVWDKRKGLNTFLELSKEIDDEYQIVLIGLNSKQIKQLPSNIIGISRTESVQELVEWYSAAYVYFNPTLEDNYPTTNLEAISCGTPVVTFETGGSPESVVGNGIIINDELKYFTTKLRCLNNIIINNSVFSNDFMNDKYKGEYIL